MRAMANNHAAADNTTPATIAIATIKSVPPSTGTPERPTTLAKTDYGVK